MRQKLISLVASLSTRQFSTIVAVLVVINIAILTLVAISGDKRTANHEPVWPDCSRREYHPVCWEGQRIRVDCDSTRVLCDDATKEGR